MNAPEIWTAKEIAEWLGYSVRHVIDRLTKQDDFPKPIVSGKGVKGKWLKAAILKWADRDGLLDHLRSAGNRRFASA